MGVERVKVVRWALAGFVGMLEKMEAEGWQRVDDDGQETGSTLETEVNYGPLYSPDYFFAAALKGGFESKIF